MTPFTKGKNMLIAKDESSARARVRVESEESKTDTVTEGGIGCDAGVR